MFTSYDELITFSTANPNRLVVLDFKATWCGPCKALKPFIEYLQNEYPTVVFKEIDIEDEDLTSITEKFSIAKVPTLIYMKNGILCHSLIGTNKANIENAINEYL
jgi:thioredoxin 1